VRFGAKTVTSFTWSTCQPPPVDNRSTDPYRLGGVPQNGEEFLHEATFSEFERPLVFAETPEKEGTSYSEFTLTLNRVIGGNARTRGAQRFKLSKQIPLVDR
jgi:hypothetical protein